MKTWVEADVPVDDHLADRLLIPVVLAGAGAFRTTRPTQHTTTNAEVIQQFVSTPILNDQESEMVRRIQVGTD